MKKILLTIICIVSVMLVFAQQPFSIKGKLSGIKEATITLAYTDEKDFADSIKTKDGSFVFNGKITKPVKGVLLVQVPKADKGTGYDIDVVHLYLESGAINISGSDAQHAIVKGGKAQADFNVLNQQLEPMKIKMEKLVEQYKKSLEEKDTVAVKLIMDQANIVNKEREKAEENFVAAHAGSYVSWDLLKQHATIIDPVVFEPLFNAMDAKFRLSEEGKKIAEQIAVSKLTAIGKTAIDFEQQDVDGRSVKLSSLRGKYLLLDFWASWCGPCRAENPNVLQAYNKYKNKQLEILAVSLDNNKERWLQAIEKDGMPWIHVSDLKGWNNVVAVEYGIRSIPQNLLIGPDGVIIAKNLRGSALEEKLEEVLK